MVTTTQIPEIDNLVAGSWVPPAEGARFDKLNPATGDRMARVARSTSADVARAVAAAYGAQPSWAALPAVRRGEILYELTADLKAGREGVARVVADETGKSMKAALGETDAAVAQGFFMAGEGQRLYGRTTTSGIPGRSAMTVRQPLGVAALIVPANTPIANLAWKVFPALICGNGVVVKAAEDAPGTAQIFAEIAARHLPCGLLNVVHGFGPEVGEPLVDHPDVAVVSFTGSTAVGQRIAARAGARLARVSLELGGKNPLIVCDDADLDKAVRWCMLSAFSNAGQRCAAASRILIFEAIYPDFVQRLVEAAGELRVGVSDEDDLGPVINERQLACMLAALERSQQAGARVLIGGHRLDRPGFYMAPTLVEGAGPEDELSVRELFGPIAALYAVKDLREAIQLANASPYGLTSCIHTRDFNRAMEFLRGIQAGVAVVNGGTHGSEPHMPFGGVKQSGNGTREPGTEALDVYSNLMDVYLHADPEAV